MLVVTTNIKQDWQKIWQPTVGKVLVVLKAANRQESPPPPPPCTNQKIVCIEARPYVPCNLALAPLIAVNYCVQFYFLMRDIHCCGHVLTMTTHTHITSGCNNYEYNGPYIMQNNGLNNAHPTPGVLSYKQLPTHSCMKRPHFLHANIYAHA